MLNNHRGLTWMILITLTNHSFRIGKLTSFWLLPVTVSALAEFLQGTVNSEVTNVNSLQALAIFNFNYLRNNRIRQIRSPFAFVITRHRQTRDHWISMLTQNCFRVNTSFGNDQIVNPLSTRIRSVRLNVVWQKILNTSHAKCLIVRIHCSETWKESQPRQREFQGMATNRQHVEHSREHNEAVLLGSWNWQTCIDTHACKQTLSRSKMDMQHLHWACLCCQQRTSGCKRLCKTITWKASEAKTNSRFFETSVVQEIATFPELLQRLLRISSCCMLHQVWSAEDVKESTKQKTIRCSP